MARKLFGLGARGHIVGQIQKALALAGHSPRKVDEIYGEDTLDAVVAFQGEKKLEINGLVDEPTWSALMHTPVPAVSERSLELTSSFEGHGYTLARGNFDGAWLTWGVIGFTMRFGQVQQILQSVQAKFPQLLTQAFGRETPRLLEVLGQPAPQQKAWATSITTSAGNLTEPWRSGFETLGSFAEVETIQRRIAYENYYRPALDSARTFGLSTELGLALVFDIHVQNGGISAAAAQQISEDVEASHDATESNIREIIAEAVAGDAIPKYRDAVRARKLCIARGQGMVNQRTYDLSNWGLLDLAASAVAG